MKTHLLTALTVLTLAAAGPSFAANETHDHGHGTVSGTLQLNAGKKWETDTPLRKSMGEIRQSMASSLHAIHENKLSSRGYGALAKKWRMQLAIWFANCKLGTQADEQLHLIIADLLAGAEQMAGKVKQAKRMDGAVKVIGALDNYGKYFDDPGFQPIAH